MQASRSQEKAERRWSSRSSSRLNANFRLGKPENATAVADFAARADAPEKLRLEALRELGDWTKPSGRDRIVGLWRPLEPRSENLAADAVRASLAGIFQGPDRVRQEASRVAGRLGIKEVGPVLVGLIRDAGRPVELRVEALRALESLRGPRLKEGIDLALADANPRVRAEGRRIWAKLEPERALQAHPRTG